MEPDTLYTRRQLCLVAGGHHESRNIRRGVPRRTLDGVNHGLRHHYSQLAHWFGRSYFPSSDLYQRTNIEFPAAFDRDFIGLDAFCALDDSDDDGVLF